LDAIFPKRKKTPKTDRVTVDDSPATENIQLDLPCEEMYTYPDCPSSTSPCCDCVPEPLVYKVKQFTQGRYTGRIQYQDHYTIDPQVLAYLGQQINPFYTEYDNDMSTNNGRCWRCWHHLKFPEGTTHQEAQQVTEQWALQAQACIKPYPSIPECATK
jgi:hypothetical protein